MNAVAPANVLHYAGPLSNEPLVLQVVRPLQTADARTDPICDVTPTGQPVEIAAHVAEGQVLLTLRVTAAETMQDDEIQIALSCRNQSIAACTVILRRTACDIGSALIERGRGSVPVRHHTVAALQWYGWRRFSEYVGLKRFTSGRSGSDVMVFRPRLLDPVDVDPSVKDFIPGVLTGGWGSCLLIKTGEARKMNEEWHRFDAFLRDRLHPFMSRLEVRLPVSPALPASVFDAMTDEERTGLTADSPTLVGSFLGGELVEAESFEQLVQHTPDTTRCVNVIDRLFAVMHPWYSDAETRPLKDWKKRIRFTDDGRYLLSGKFDFTQQADRIRYREPLAWDVDFISQDHLRKHLLGKEDARDGLLYRLAEIECSFSLTHGDLHTRNVLADPDNVWLLDFGEAGPSPTLFDFAKLEVYLRYWCLRLKTGHSDFEQAASDFESLLLDHITGSEASLEPVRRLAPSIGAAPDELLRVATCICAVRRHAMRYSLGSPDRRDYLAILYLTVLDVLRFAGQAPREVSNFRLLVNMAWVLEDALSRIVGLTPVERRRHSTRETDHIDREWIATPGLPGRVHYLMQSHDRGALAPLAATRGVTQSRHHHLNVYDHTLLVLAYLESILDDPLAALLDPAEQDEHVRAKLLQEGIRLPPFASHHRDPQKPRVELTPDEGTSIESVLQQCIDVDSQLVLKTCAIFHDVGKPVSRAVTVKNNGTRSVQFLGHEVYSKHLAQEFLDEVYDGPGDASLKERIVHLILSHHGHHDLVNRFSQDESHRKNLDEIVSGGRPSKSDWSFLSKFMNPDVTTFARDFPLQILHGYADMLACRGRERNRFVSVTDVAEIDLRLLQLFSRFEDWQ